MIVDGFRLVGGNPALDFVNTVHNWTVAEPEDRLPAFRDALRFGEAAGILSRGEARRLRTRPTKGELSRLWELRARLERIFRALVSAKAPPPGDLEALDKDGAAAARAARLRRLGRGLTRAIAVDAAGAAALRWRIIEAAITLLTSAQLDRVKACPNCGWFFLDTSKNRSRRWCSMAMCGTNAKARAYYWRHKRR